MEQAIKGMSLAAVFARELVRVICLMSLGGQAGVSLTTFLTIRHPELERSLFGK
jgi:hypothetical protein